MPSFTEQVLLRLLTDAKQRTQRQTDKARSGCIPGLEQATGQVAGTAGQVKGAEEHGRHSHTRPEGPGTHAGLQADRRREGTPTACGVQWPRPSSGAPARAPGWPRQGPGTARAGENTGLQPQGPAPSLARHGSPRCGSHSQRVSAPQRGFCRLLSAVFCLLRVQHFEILLCYMEIKQSFCMHCRKFKMKTNYTHFTPSITPTSPCLRERSSKQKNSPLSPSSAISGLFSEVVYPVQSKQHPRELRQ